jgi:chaperone modulatory protein CbpM
MSMADSDGFVIDGIVVEEQLSFTLAALCRACGADSEQVLALVHEGVLAPSGDAPAAWHFAGASLPRARTVLRLTRELGIDLAGAAIVMDLLAEIDALRTRLHELTPVRA